MEGIKRDQNWGAWREDDVLLHWGSDFFDNFWVRHD
jgi:hypothetical protein